MKSFNFTSRFRPLISLATSFALIAVIGCGSTPSGDKKAADPATQKGKEPDTEVKTPETKKTDPPPTKTKGDGAAIDAAKLIGNWTWVKIDGEAPAGDDPAHMEFLADGKCKLHGEKEGKKVSIDATYHVDGNKISLSAKKKTKDLSREYTVKSLTDDTLIVTHARAGRDREMTFKKK